MRNLSIICFFTYNGQQLDIEDVFVYLGALFSSNRRFVKNNQRLADQLEKLCFCIKKISQITFTH